MKVYIKYLFSIICHKWLVLRVGLIIGKIPFWRLLIHDWSKFTPAEFFCYARYKYGRSGDREEWAIGWLHHLHFNAHHSEHWVLTWCGDKDFYTLIGEHKADYVVMLPMPEVYVREMLADMHATSKQVTGSWEISKWLNANGPKVGFHEDTLVLIDKVMRELGYVLTANCDWSWALGLIPLIKRS